MGILAVPRGGGAAPLFDDHADATWPHLDAPGKRVLYISFRRDARRLRGARVAGG